MRIINLKNYDEMSKKAADLVAEAINKTPNLVLGLATGSTPLKTYEILSEMYQDGQISFQNVTGFNLDEYVGLSKEHNQSFYYYLNHNLISKTDFKEDNLHVINGMADDLIQACYGYERLIQDAGGVDFQLLGIGTDGHIGFNEPDDYFPSMTHTSKLEEETRQANARFFDSMSDVPTEAVTMGIGTIMHAKTVLLMVNGAAKGKILAEALYGKVEPKIPASILQFHQNCTVLVDEAVWQELQLANTEG